MNKVVVTGATGFIGKAVLNHLAQKGYEIHAISRKAHSNESIFYHVVDLQDRVRVKKLLDDLKAHYLIHLAWETTYGHFYESSFNYDWVESSLYLIQCFIEAGGKRALFAGTCAEYGSESSTCKEPFNPPTLYGSCKHQLRLELEKLKPLSWCWGRIFYPYGPYENPHRFIPSFIIKFLKKEKAICKSREHIRDFLYIEDIASAFIFLLESSFHGPINICSGKGYKLEEIALFLSHCLNSSSLLQLQSTPSFSHNPLSVVGDPSLLTQLGWSSKFTIEAGLQKTVDWWKHEIYN